MDLLRKTQRTGDNPDPQQGSAEKLLEEAILFFELAFDRLGNSMFMLRARDESSFGELCDLVIRERPSMLQALSTIRRLKEKVEGNGKDGP